MQRSDGTRIETKEDIVRTHLEVLEDLLGPEGTIVFPTHSWGLVGSGEVFDPATTPSDYTFGEIARQIRDCRRQFHPFASVAACGASKDRIITPGLHRHAYGLHSPFWHMGACNALHISLGQVPALTISAVHHCEAMAMVPYRYVKAFDQACFADGGIRNEEFFLFVTYLIEGGLKRDRNRKIMSLPAIAQTIGTHPLGRSSAYSLPLGTFINETTLAMQRSPFIWLSERPVKRPWEV